MGKKAKAKMGILDKLPNRKYVIVTFAAATTTAVYTQFSTMMGAREGSGWLVSRMDVTPLGPVGPPPGPGDISSFIFQLATGGQVAPLACDDDEVVGTTFLQSLMSTSGATMIQWPLTWIGPVLLASRQLTCSMDAQADVTIFQNVSMLFTIWYQWVALGAREWVEIAEARGVA